MQLEILRFLFPWFASLDRLLDNGFFREGLDVPNSMHTSSSLETPPGVTQGRARSDLEVGVRFSLSELSFLIRLERRKLLLDLVAGTVWDGPISQADAEALRFLVVDDSCFPASTLGAEVEDLFPMNGLLKLPDPGLQEPETVASTTKALVGLEGSIVFIICESIGRIMPGRAWIASL